MEERAYGAKIPDSISWQMGKTPASIRFVNDAEELMSQSNSDINKFLLRGAIEKIKTEELVFLDPKSPEEYLKEWDESWSRFFESFCCELMQIAGQDLCQRQENKEK